MYFPRFTRGMATYGCNRARAGPGPKRLDDLAWARIGGANDLRAALTMLCCSGKRWEGPVRNRTTLWDIREPVSHNGGLRASGDPPRRSPALRTGMLKGDNIG